VPQSDGPSVCCGECRDRVEVADTVELLIVPPGYRNPRPGAEAADLRAAWSAADCVRVCDDCAERLEGPWTRQREVSPYEAADVYRR
jgi:hypothetical protein